MIINALLARVIALKALAISTSTGLSNPETARLLREIR